ncbi:MAG TPA: SoxXA-binding protein [Chromatiaceae bacterium]|nr:SoxXA-binding protein [Chromatiaceae bacterium]
MKRMLLLMSMVAVLGVAGCASTSGDSMQKAAAAATPAEAYQQVLAEAKAAKKKAASVDGEWRDIGKILKKAEAAAKKGDYAKATKLAEYAKFQGEMGYKQAISQRGVGNPDYLN